MSSSKIFRRNRALGYVSNHVPHISRYIFRRKENVVVTCLGKSFHTYSCSHFSLLNVSGLHESDINCIAANKYLVFTASANKVYAWRHGTELKHIYVGHSDNVILLLPFGAHIISVDESSNVIVWDVQSEELYLSLNFSNDVFEITALTHPHTYLNKVLFGSRQGSLQLWNIRSSKLIYTFKGWDSRVTVLEQAPAIDVVAVGLENGRIIIHNLKYDQTIVEFVQDWGCVTSLSFRLDGHPILASGSLIGHIVFWNLEERKLASQLLLAHKGAVTGLGFLPSEPLMITSSPDNSIKMWIFDTGDENARLLKLREGHALPPTFLRFHGSDGRNILSSGGDCTLRVFSTINEALNKSFGKASFNRKSSKKKKRYEEDVLSMPPITEFTSETTREKEWDNITAIHHGIDCVTAWSFDKSKMGDIKFRHDRFKGLSGKGVCATCICLTHCGNFVVIGYSSGHVDRYNIQSGIHRETYGNPVAHKGQVRGVATDGLNQFTITGGSEAVLKFWRFKLPGSKPVGKIAMEESIAFIRSHHESSILAIALDDFSINLVDIETRIIIRKFSGHSGRVTDASFSPDSRWLVTSSMDGTIRTWDIPSSQLIDCFQTDSPCVSLSFSPVGSYLSTVHVNYLGIYLWTNMTLFNHVSLRPLTESDTIPLIELPGTEKEEIEETLQDGEDIEYKSPEQIGKDLVTMSQLPNSRWQNLLNIDIIKKKNKPKEPLKVPKSAPFFLPTIPSLELTFDTRNKEEDADELQESSQSFHLQSLTVFGKLLQDSVETNDFDSAFEKLKSFGPSVIDFEIKSLAPEGGGSICIILQFIKMICKVLKSYKDFEVAQSYLGLLLQSHGQLLTSERILRNELVELQKCQHMTWKPLEEKLMYNLSIVSALKSM